MNAAVAPVTKLFDETEIARRVDQLAGEIAEAVSGELTIVGLLTGSFVFVSDLVRALDRAGLAPQVKFIGLSSYGHAKESSGEVRLICDLPGDIAGQRILLVDDIVDTGLSLAFAKTLVLERGAAKVWTCALVDKPSRREVDISADFTGFVVDNVFVVGYGIDYADAYRHLPYIGKID